MHIHHIQAIGWFLLSTRYASIHFLSYFREVYGLAVCCKTSSKTCCTWISLIWNCTVRVRRSRCPEMFVYVNCSYTGKWLIVAIYTLLFDSIFIILPGGVRISRLLQDVVHDLLYMNIFDLELYSSCTTVQVAWNVRIRKLFISDGETNICYLHTTLRFNFYHTSGRCTE